MAFSGRRGELAFFVYDHMVLQKEEDDLKDAIIYFSPESMSADDQCALCGQIMGMCEFLKATLGQSSPKLYKFEHSKFALKRFGSYSLALERAFFTPDAVLIAQLLDLYETFVAFHGGLDSLKLRYKEVKNGFTHQLSEICRNLLSVSRVTSKPPLTMTLQALPYVSVPKSASHLFLQASQLLQSCQRRPYVLSGVIFYKNEVLCTQLSPRLTRHLIFLQNEFPHIEKKTEFDLPVGCRLVTMFLPDHELQDIVPLDPLARRHCKSTDFSLRRDKESTFSRRPSHMKIIDRSMTCPELKLSSNEAARLEQAHEHALNLASSQECRKAGYNPGQDSVSVERLSWGKDMKKLSLTQLSIKESLSDRESEQGETYEQVVNQEQLWFGRTDDEGSETDYTTDHASPTPALQDGMVTLNLDQCLDYPIGSIGELSSHQENVAPMNVKTVGEQAVNETENESDVPIKLKDTTSGNELSKDLKRSHNTTSESSEPFEVSADDVVSISDLEDNADAAVKEHSEQAEETTSKSNNLKSDSVDTTSFEDKNVKSSVSMQSEGNSDNDDVFVSFDESDKNETPLVEPRKSAKRLGSANSATRKKSRVSFTDEDITEVHKRPTESYESDIDELEDTDKGQAPESELETEYEDFESRVRQQCIDCLEVIPEKSTGSDRQLVTCEKCKEKETGNVSAFSDTDQFVEHFDKHTDQTKHLSKTRVHNENHSRHIGHSAMSNTGGNGIQTKTSTSSTVSDATVEGDSAKSANGGGSSKKGPHDSLGGSSSYNSDRSSSGSSAGMYWSPGMVGLNDVTLYVQRHSDISLMLVMEKPEQYEENVLHALWKGCLNTLADLDYSIKEVLDSENGEKSHREVYKYMKFDRFSSSLRGTFEDQSNEHMDKKTETKCQMVAVLHAEFDQRQCMTDILLKSQSACCYGHQTHVDETFFAPSGEQRHSSGLPSQRDAAFTLDNVARQRLAKDIHISLL